MSEQLRVDVDVARETYLGSGLEHVEPGDPPWHTLASWLADAVHDDRVYEPTAMALATSDSTGPNVRVLLAKDLNPDGISFYTHSGSQKGRELAEHPAAAAVFPWHSMFRQVRVRGTVHPLPRSAATTYFASRPRTSQIASAVSQQSEPLSNRVELTTRVDQATKDLEGAEVPLPAGWGGYQLAIHEVELWVGMPSRLHDRIRWRSRTSRPAPLDDRAVWSWTRLNP